MFLMFQLMWLINTLILGFKMFGVRSCLFKHSWCWWKTEKGEWEILGVLKCL